MTPAEDEQRRVDGLLASYGELRGELTRLDERTLAQIRAIKDLEGRLMARIGDVDDTCEEFRVEVRSTWAEERAEREKRKASSRTVVVAIIMSAATVLASIVAAAAVIVTGG